ncbi:MAG: methionyl-tRNA formyltransferase [Proteobacteria bacterium]|nr:methionyl-tRNA formyltransferase [Pseudomonadota bacterium]
MRVQTTFIGNESPFLDAIQRHSDLKYIVCTKISRKARKFFGSAFNYAKEHNIKIIEPEEFTVHPCPTDLIIVAGYPKLIPRHIINYPRIGIINIHMSLLPAYRGRHPLNWAIINGERQTGVTIHHINEDFDEGNIICQHRIPIKNDDTVMDVYKKAVITGNLLIKRTFDIISLDHFRGIQQDKRFASYYPPRKPKDGKVNWSDTAVKIRNLVRALTEPYPGAYFYYQGGKMIVDEVEVVRLPKHNAEKGKPFLLGGFYTVKTGDEYLKIIKLRNRIQELPKQPHVVKR